MALDKKAEGDGVRCVLLTKIGACTGAVIESGRWRDAVKATLGCAKPACGFHPRTVHAPRSADSNRWNRWIAKQSVRDEIKNLRFWWGSGQRPRMMTDE
ncbi:MAG: hypothetical protein ACLUHE_10205 [Christensenellales bacterium]